MLADYAGTVILISHDRDFLDRVVHAVIVPDGNGRWIEYAGGYADMLAQRGAEPSGKPAAQEKPDAPAKPPAQKAEKPKPAKPGLSFSDQHKLKALPETISKLQETVRKLERPLADPELYARDPKAFAQATEALAAAQAELSAAEEQWLELEMLREEGEG